MWCYADKAVKKGIETVKSTLLKLTKLLPKPTNQAHRVAVVNIHVKSFCSQLSYQKSCEKA